MALFGNMFDKLAEDKAGRTPIKWDRLRMYLEMVCKSGFDRMPMRVRNLGIPFYLAGYNDTHVFLTHAESCMVSQFAFDDLEPVLLDQVEKIQEQIIAWMDSAEGAETIALINTAKQALTGRIPVPVNLRWADGINQRKGFLTFHAQALGGVNAHWLCGIEVIEGQNVIFRYSLSRVSSFAQENGAMIMNLKPDTPF